MSLSTGEILTDLKVILPGEVSEVNTPIPGVGAKKFQTSQNKDRPGVVDCPKKKTVKVGRYCSLCNASGGT